jgi:cell division transport system permease protein
VKFGLVMSEAANGLRRNVSMVISVILVTFISLTFVGAAVLLQLQISQTKGYWYDRAEVAVYLCNDIDGGNCAQQAATKDQIDAVEAQLKSNTLAPFIKTYSFETHDEAFTHFQEQFGSTSFSGLVTPDFLPESFRVKLNDPAQADVLIESLSGHAGVQSVQDQRKLLDPIFSALNAASITAVGLALLMLIAAVLLIATTIRLSAFSRRRELGIMRLVGASNRYIQTPFILEGVFAALIGSALASAAIVALVQFFVRGYLQTQFPTIALIGLGDALLVVPILIVVGAVLAASSAGFAINRYLKV